MFEIIKSWPLFFQFVLFIVIMWFIYLSIEIIFYYIAIFINGWPSDKNNIEIDNDD